MFGCIVVDVVHMLQCMLSCCQSRSLQSALAVVQRQPTVGRQQHQPMALTFSRTGTISFVSGIENMKEYSVIRQISLLSQPDMHSAVCVLWYFTTCCMVYMNTFIDQKDISRQKEDLLHVTFSVCLWFKYIRSVLTRDHLIVYSNLSDVNFPNFDTFGLR